VVSAGEPAYAVISVVDGDVEVATVSITGTVPALFVADAVSRLELAARRLGWSVRLRQPRQELTEAMHVCGLHALTGPDPRPSLGGPATR
jgi:predicted solute-binding protein